MKYTSPINWDDAPEWANWFAVDGDDGLAAWFENEPQLDYNVWTCATGIAVGIGHVQPVILLEQRPAHSLDKEIKINEFFHKLKNLIEEYASE